MKKFTVIAMLIAIVLLGIACAPAITQEEYDAVTAERDAVKSELSSLKSDLNQLILTTDMVRGHIPSEYGPTCAMSNIYHRGEMIVWRTRVIDPETGNQLPANPKELLASPPEKEALASMTENIKVTIHLSDGQSFPMHFGGHAGPADFFWTYGWEIPTDYPTGTVEAWVTAEVQNKSGRWDPFNVPPSLLTIME